MKKISNVFLLFFFALFPCIMNAFESYTSEDEKFSVNIVIANDEVFLQVANHCIATEGLQATGEGILVLVNGEWITISQALENPECIRSRWECKKCGYMNFDGISACAVCGKPRYGN